MSRERIWKIAVLLAIPALIWFTVPPDGLAVNAWRLFGFYLTATWLVFSAFSLSIAFVHTGLGKRMAFILIDKIGHTTLRLGYVGAILDFIISPVTPSNTARAGGVVLPIMNSVSLALGSEPRITPEKAGAYLACNT